MTKLTKDEWLDISTSLFFHLLTLERNIGVAAAKVQVEKLQALIKKCAQIAKEQE